MSDSIWSSLSDYLHIPVNRISAGVFFSGSGESQERREKGRQPAPEQLEGCNLLPACHEFMPGKPVLATLCYLKHDGKTLMLHRIKKENDIHKGKWNGLGGKLESGETPEECVIREVREESGFEIKNPRLKGILTFPDFSANEDWYVFLFTAHEFSGSKIDSPEGQLQWIPDEKLLELPLWEGDRIFLPLLEKNDFFSGKFIYRNGVLIEHSIVFHGRFNDA